MSMDATYSPEDNKLRLRSSSRLDKELYLRVKGAGFTWAAKQGLFVAPMWTPAREDLLLELCGEIEDEDTTREERAEQRAERFDGYRENRANDAERASEAVRVIADGIPLGQPILIGHHSQRHAERDAKKIENGMRKAVNMWETSKYWKSRAAGAVAHAKYVERPDVRARRIKTIEADKRREERERDSAAARLRLWTRLHDDSSIKKASGAPSTFLERALVVCNHMSDGAITLPDGTRYHSAWSALRDEKISPEEVQRQRVAWLPVLIAHCERWINHCNNRLEYEKAMLESQGASDLLKSKPRPKQLPLYNYRAPDGLKIENLYNRGNVDHYDQIEMTSAEYQKINSDYRGTRIVGNSHRVRTAYVRGNLSCVFLTDSKVHEIPATVPKAPAERARAQLSTHVYTAPERTVFDDMKQTLDAGGVKAVSAPQLFPTPPELAARLVEEAQILSRDRVLEPSAGTGNLIKAIRDSVPEAQIVAIEIRDELAELLFNRYSKTVSVISKDFLQCNGSIGKFDRVVMNPPFADGQDVEHVEHALGMLNEGGRLVAVMANGVMHRSDKRTRAFRDRIDELGGVFEELPANSFKESGTGVNVVMLTVSV